MFLTSRTRNSPLFVGNNLEASPLSPYDLFRILQLFITDNNLENILTYDAFSYVAPWRKVS